MRTTLDVDEEVLQEAMKLLGVKTKREAVRRALQAIIAQKRREALRAKLGQLDLALTLEDLVEMRQGDRHFVQPAEHRPLRTQNLL